MTEHIKYVEIFSDGACKGNPGKGGWGAVLIYLDHIKEINGFEPDTTNNIMELTAVIKAIESLKEKCHIKITTDSNYVKEGISTWIHTWKENGWKTANKKIVKNKNLWMQLDELSAKHIIEWKWVKAHAGDPMNEEVDCLAKKAAESN